MKQITTIILCIGIGYILGHTIYSAKCSVYLKDAILTADEICEKRLADPHHCVSVCVEILNKGE